MLNCDESSEQIVSWKNDAKPAARPRRGGLPRLPTVELHILRGQARQKTRPVQVPVFLIGAALDCDLVLGDRQTPDVYAYLYVTRDGVSIRRLGVGPALYVRGVQVESAQLRHGDRVRIGDLFEFEIGVEASVPRPADEPPLILRWDSAQRPVGHVGVSNRQVLLSPN